MTARLNSARTFAVALAIALLAGSSTQAQDAPALAPNAPVATVAAALAAPAVGPTLESATVGVRQQGLAEPRTAPVPAGPASSDGAKLMILGGAAILTGIVVGGNPGYAITVGGAVVGLYGLYKYLQ